MLCSFVWLVIHSMNWCVMHCRPVADIKTVTITTHFWFSVPWQINHLSLTNCLIEPKVKNAISSICCSRSHLQQFAPTIIQLALLSNCTHKIFIFVCSCTTWKLLYHENYAVFLWQMCRGLRMVVSQTSIIHLNSKIHKKKQKIQNNTNYKKQTK